MYIHIYLYWFYYSLKRDLKYDTTPEATRGHDTTLTGGEIFLILLIETGHTLYAYPHPSSAASSQREQEQEYTSKHGSYHL